MTSALDEDLIQVLLVDDSERSEQQGSSEMPTGLCTAATVSGKKRTRDQ